MTTRYTKQLCVDIIFLNSQVENSFRQLHHRILERNSYSHGAIYRHETETRTKLNGKETTLLVNMAKSFVDGEILGVDGVLNDGINISINVTEDEARRVKNDTERFRVKAEIDINIVK